MASKGILASVLPALPFKVLGQATQEPAGHEAGSTPRTRPAGLEREERNG